MKIFDKIKNKIRHIQSQPEKAKNRIIWILALVVTASIGIIWSVFFMKYEDAPKNGNDSTPIWKDIGSNLKDKVGGGFNNLRDNYLPEVKDLIKEEKAKTEESKKSETN